MVGVAEWSLSYRVNLLDRCPRRRHLLCLCDGKEHFWIFDVRKRVKSSSHLAISHLRCIVWAWDNKRPDSSAWWADLCYKNQTRTILIRSWNCWCNIQSQVALYKQAMLWNWSLVYGAWNECLCVDSQTEANRNRKFTCTWLTLYEPAIWANIEWLEEGEEVIENRIEGKKWSNCEAL